MLARNLLILSRWKLARTEVHEVLLEQLIVVSDIGLMNLMVASVVTSGHHKIRSKVQAMATI